jgi:hypothetical protein
MSDINNMFASLFNLKSADESKQCASNELINKISLKINMASQNGDFQLSVPEFRSVPTSARDYCIVKLQSKGYVVVYSRSRECYLVRWE